MSSKPSRPRGPVSSNPKLARHPAVYTTHHIGASTAQAQEAIAAEVVAMINDYEKGIVRNVVNLTPPPPIGSVMVIRHYDRVGVLSAVLEGLKREGLNVQEMQNLVFAGAGAAVATIHVEGEIPETVTGRGGRESRRHQRHGTARPPMNRWLLPVKAGLVRPESAAEVISPAYDLFPPPERLRIARARPRSFLNATLSEEDYPDLDIERRRVEAHGLSPQGTRCRHLAVSVARGWRSSVWKAAATSRPGWSAMSPRSAFPELIRPHEDTRPRRVADLADYLEAVGYGSSPVGLTYRRRPEIDSMVSRLTERDPDLDVTLEDGDRQTVWLVDDAHDLGGLDGGVCRGSRRLHHRRASSGGSHGSARRRSARSRRAGFWRSPSPTTT